MTPHTRSSRILFASLLFILQFLFPRSGFPEVPNAAPAAVPSTAPLTVISAESLEYFADEKKYVAKGSVKIEKEGTVVEADKITYFEDTSETIAEGNVRYKDKDSAIKGARAELNLDKQTGKLFDAEIFQKKDNYHLAGQEIEKRSETSYYSNRASFTVCDAPVPAWCFRGRDVKTNVGEQVTAKDVTFRIKGLPVLYAPYFWASLVTERQSGFLQPTFGTSNTLGAHVNVPYFWAISENSDATFVLDAYSKRGIGTGAEFRYLGLGGIKTNWWLYHIRDTEEERDFVEVRGVFEDRHPEGLGGYLNVNYLNESDFYRIYSYRHEMTSLRFLESTGELNQQYTNSRLYLLAQYRVDLEFPTDQAPQKLPEIGYVLNYSKVGPFMFSSEINAEDLWRENGLSAARVDFYPKLLHSIGTDYVLTQMFALRETAYDFYKNHDEGNDLTERAALEYNISAHTRLYKSYSSFTHIVEPSIGYHFIYTTDNDLPVFDSTDTFRKTSAVELSVLNRFMVKGTEMAVVRLTQALDSYKPDGSLLPFKFEAGLRYPFPLTVEATYDVQKGRLETVTSNLAVNFPKLTLNVGQRYNESADVLTVMSAATFHPFSWLQMMGIVWYDTKQQDLSNASIVVRYLRQCWGIRFEATKRPGDFAMTVRFDLAGLGSKATRGLFPTGSYEPF